MHLIAGFESNAYVEIALEEIKEQCHIPDREIAFVEMNPQEKPQTFLDSIHYSDGFSSLDAAAAWAVVGGVLGIIYGSKIWLGSVTIGLLGAIFGGLIGFFFDKKISRNKQSKKQIRHIEVLLFMHFNSYTQLEKASSICRANNVISLGTHGYTKLAENNSR